MVLAATEDDGADALAQGGEVFVIFRATFFIEFVEVAVEAEKRTKEGWIEEIADGVKLVDAVLDGCAGEDEGVVAVEPLDGLGCFGGPVFDALGFVEDNDVWLEEFVDVEAIADDLLVVDDGKKGRVTIRVVVCASTAGAEDDALGKSGEFSDLILPFAFQRCRRDDEHAFCFSEMVEQGAGGNGLDGFAQTHFVGEEGALAEGEVEHPLALVRVERVKCDVFWVLTCNDSAFVVAAEGGAFGVAFAGLEKRLHVLRDAEFWVAAEFLKNFW